MVAENFSSIYWKAYTNYEAVNIIKVKLSPNQFGAFRNTCFDYLVDISKVNIQLQLIHCLMDKELNLTPKDIFAIEVNGEKLCFGLREFDVVTGLRGVGASDLRYDTEGPSEFVMEYFLGEVFIEKNLLKLIFENINWLNISDDVKFVVLYFIEFF